MKHLTVLLALFLAFGLTTVQAQSNAKSSKSCCSAKAAAACAEKAAASGTADAAAKVASLDASIESRTCPHSGVVSYVRKVSNPDTGDVTYEPVEYNSESGKFVNVSPSAKKGCCSKGEASGCCAGEKSAKKDKRS